VPGAVTQFRVPKGAFLSPDSGPTFNSCGSFDIAGVIPLQPAAWDRLQPGPCQLLVTFTGLAERAAPNPTNFPPVDCRQSWTLLANASASIQKYRDETLAAAVQKTLSCSIAANPKGICPVCSPIYADPAAPIGLAFDVSIRRGATEWKSAQPWASIPKGDQYANDTIFFPNAPLAPGQRVDVILRPSIAAALRTVHIDRVLDHTFVLKDVVIQEPVMYKGP
jgi:hypothetical protein